MQVYQTDTEGFFIGPVLADADPLDKGNWLIPGGCVQTPPPPLAEGQRLRWLDGKWSVIAAPTPEPAPEPPTPEQLLAAERAAMSCTPMQGILTLGETEWAKIEAYRDSAPWGQKVVINSAQDWKRNSQNIAFFAYLLGYSDAQVDDLFRAAMQVKA